MANNGLDGSRRRRRPELGRLRELRTRSPTTSINNPGTWADHTDIRPTMMALTGLKDDYIDDGRVLTEELTVTPEHDRQGRFQPLAVCYKQLNSSVGQFGTDMLLADTAALKTGSANNDSTYKNILSQITSLGAQRDALATQIKGGLYNAEFNGKPIKGNDNYAHCQNVLRAADKLAG